jgi:succinate dehydrogenase / fumarate reductase iron-sulfur subunit
MYQDHTFPGPPTLAVHIACTDTDDTNWRSFSVPYTKWMTVNDVLNYITDELGEDVAYRRYCGVKKCGLCTVVANGHEVLACWSPVTTSTLHIEPLRNLPLIRDLVIDRSHYERAIQEQEPYLVRSGSPAEFPEPLPHGRMRNAPALDCLSCLACVSAESPGHEDDGQDTNAYMPALLVQVAQQALDPRDSTGTARARALPSEAFERTYAAGSAACPVHIDIDRDVVSPLAALRQQATPTNDPEQPNSSHQCKA